jgi:hemerythrin-like metal-binding protein
MKILRQIFPEWLYNALPYGYLSAGFLAEFLIPGYVGDLICIALVGLAIFIWILRYRYRKEFVHSEEHINTPSVLDTHDLPEHGLIQLSWSTALECGHPVIDGQHRRLFGIANEAINLLLAKQPKEQEEPLLDKLVAHLEEHFSTEEAVLAEASDPTFAEHCEHHQSLLAKAKAMRDRYHNDKIFTREMVDFLATEVISEHIMKEDLQLKASTLR